ncbi:MAG: cupredoxin domain-containing protein [Acidimicrobiales bacterium]|nr:cupredoxin domain-containing protein [Acidimicrobiales bacterium]
MRRIPLLLCAGALLAAPLAACGDDDDTGSDTTTPAAGDGPTVEVGAQDDLSFDKESYEVEAGNVTFRYVNEGNIPHTLLIKDMDDFKLDVGDEDEGSVELEPGTYELYCDIPGHEPAGMVAELTVS